MKINKHLSILYLLMMGSLTLSTESAFSSQENQAIQCGSSTNIFEQQLCKSIYLEKFSRSDNSYTLMTNEEIFYSTSGFKDGEIQTSGCSYELDGRGGYASASVLASSSLSFFNSGQFGNQVAVLKPKLKVQVTQRLKDRQGIKKPWPLKGCTFTNWDRFSANAFSSDIESEIYLAANLNITFRVDPIAGKYIVSLNPKISVAGGLKNDIDLDFEFSGRNRSILEQIVLDITRLGSGIWVIPEALINKDSEAFSHLTPGILNDAGQYNYFGTSITGEVGAYIVEIIENEANKRAANSDYFFKTQSQNIERELNERIGNIDGRGVELEFDLSLVNGKALAPILPALLLI